MAQTTPSSGQSGSRILTNILVIIIVAAIVGVLVWTLKPAPESATDTSTPSFGFNNESDKLQVGFVLVGPTSDWGYNYQHNQGRLAMEARLRDKVHTVVAENIPETAEVERIMQRMIDEGGRAYLRNFLRLPGIGFTGGREESKRDIYALFRWKTIRESRNLRF